MRIVLNSPQGTALRHWGGIFKRLLRYMPLTLPTLAALVPELDADIHLVDEGIEDVDPVALRADLVGLTVITGIAPLLRAGGGLPRAASR